MAFMRLIMTASKLTKLKRELVEEKTDAIKISKKEQTKKKFRHYTIRLRMKIRKLLRKALSCFFFEKFCYNLRHDGTCVNYTLKSIVGFVCGFVLTYIFFMFCMFQLNFTLPTATVFCSILGCILMIGLAFSSKVRCVVLLVLPQFFSQKGRQALMAYAFILCISGPTRNVLNNMGILSESLACGQEQLKQAVRQIIDVIKKPFLALKEAIKKVVKTVKEIVKKIKEILLTIKRIIMAILKVIKAAFQFLAKIINICNKELGTPFERCTRVFENAIADCNAKLGPLFSWLCSLAYIVQSVCYLVKFLDLICIIVDFISDSIVGVVIRKVKIFIRHIRTMFYVRIKFSHSFEFHMNSTRTISEIAREIVGEIKERTEMLRAIFKFMTSAAALFFMFIIIKTTYYRYKFLTSERFDNKYINKDFREIDLRRAKLGKETVLPLNDREMQVYVSVGSKKLAKSEKKALAKAASTLATACVKIAMYMIADYSLFWVLNLIKYYGRFQSKVQAPNMPSVHISGKGFLADLLRSIVNAFQPAGIHLEIDTVPCLPTPIPPDYDRYVQIATVLLLCWVLTLLEPYGLRLRHVVMCYYHPTRGKQRAIWLYNHIMRARNSFLKFARRQLRRKVLGDGSIAKITCKEFLAANFTICRVCLGEGLQKCCLLCGEVFRESDDKKPIQCHTPDCPGIYCEQCFADLQNLCTICLSPIEYGDLSDISEEKDSSEEERKVIKAKETKKKTCTKWFICSNCCKKCFQDGTAEEEDTTSKPRLKKSDGGDKDSSDEEGKLLKDHDQEDIEKKDRKTDTKDDDVNKTKDSDYYSSDDSTEYSYSYQYDKNYDSQPTPVVTPFKDVEKQEIPDYASMSSFREEPDEVEVSPRIMLDKTTSTLAKRSVGTVISGTTLEKHRRSRKVDFLGVQEKSTTTMRRKKKKKKVRKGEERPLLDDSNSCSCTCSGSDDDGYLKPLQSPVLTLLKSSSSLSTPDKYSHYVSSSEDIAESSSSSSSVTNRENENDFRDNQTPPILQIDLSNVDTIHLPIDTIPTSSGLTSETKCSHQYVQLPLPELDLSSTTSTPHSCRDYIKNIFRNVKYDEVSESPRSTDSQKSMQSTKGTETPKSMDSRKSTKSSKCLEAHTSTGSSFPKTVKFDKSTECGNFPTSTKSSKSIKSHKSSSQYNSSTEISPLEESPKDIPLRLQPGMSLSKTDKAIPSTSRSNRNVDLSSEPLDNYKCEEKLKKKVKEYYNALKDIPCEETGEKRKQGKFMKFVQKMIPKRKKDTDVLPLYTRDNRQNLELKSYSQGWNTPSSTTLNSAILRQRSIANRENDSSSEEEVEGRVRGGESGRIRNFSRILNQSLGTNLFGTDSTSYRYQNHITKEILARYFVSIEDLTPTRDCDIPMTAIESPKPCSYRKNEVLIREVPEKDTTQNKAKCGSPRSASARLLCSGSSSHHVQTTSSSNLSESFCTSVAGVPCNIRDFRTPSVSSNLEGKECKAPEHLTVIPESEVLEENDRVDCETRSYRGNSKEEPGHNSRSSLIANKHPPCKVSTYCSCESIANKDEVTQTCPCSILKQQRSVTTIKSDSNASEDSQTLVAETTVVQNNPKSTEQNQNSVVESGTITEAMERVVSTTDKIVETTEKYPVKEEAPKPSKALLTSDKMQQTSDNVTSSSSGTISKTPASDGSFLTAQNSPSSDAYCDCRRPEIPRNQHNYNRYRCPPAPPRYDEFRSRDMGYEAIPRRAYSGYRDDHPRILSDSPSEFSLHSAPVERGHPRRQVMEFSSGERYCLPECKYRESIETARYRPERPKSRQKSSVICSCNGDCRCCVKKRPAPQSAVSPRYRPIKDETSSSSEPEDAEEYTDEDDNYHESHPNRHDLPYQNSDDYLDLVQELEETLQSRNRNRVRRAMQEFERRSKYNKPLEKPIIDYDETSESEEPIIQKITQLTSEKKRCCAGDLCSCRRDARLKISEDRRSQPKQKVKVKGYPPTSRDPQVSLGSGGKTRWQMNINSGEWYKVSENQSRYKGHRRPKTPSPRRICPRDCSCCAKKYDFR